MVSNLEYLTSTEPKYHNGTTLMYMVSNLEYLTSAEPKYYNGTNVK